ncbi:MAG: GNAT family N-acetyltransferase [Bacteroidales bacterium]|jgi:hypothetical protein|nr:GNAT family N-acetyltransferase [Bacteroidales bacterium]
MEDFKILDLNDKDKWDEFLNRLPSGKKDVYFTPEYYDLYEKNGDGKTICIVYEQDTNIVIYPFLVNSINALGYELENEYYDIQGAYGYNGVLTNSMNPGFIDGFYKLFDEYCKQNNIIAEFTRFHPLLGNYEFSKKHMQIILDRETVSLDLRKNYEDIWSNEYTSKNRNMIRKAQKDGHTFEIIKNPSLNQINTFISLYFNSMGMVKAEDYYLFNQEFFHNTFSLLKDNSVLVNILQQNKDIVCSSVFLFNGEFFHYHLSGRSGGASNAVNNYLLDEAVKYAKIIGARRFHFGGGRSSDPGDSLLKFKSNLSKTRMPFYIGKRIHNKSIYKDIIIQWENKYPEKKEKYKNYLLKYRY